MKEFDLRMLHDAPEEPRLRRRLCEELNLPPVALHHTLEALLDVFPQMEHVTMHCSGSELDRVFDHCNPANGETPDEEDRRKQLRQLLMNASLEYSSSSSTKQPLLLAAFARRERAALGLGCDLVGRVLELPECDGEFLTTSHPLMKGFAPMHKIIEARHPRERILDALAKVAQGNDSTKLPSYLLPLAYYSKDIVKHLLDMGVPVDNSHESAEKGRTAFASLCRFGRPDVDPDASTYYCRVCLFSFRFPRFRLIQRIMKIQLRVLRCFSCSGSGQVAVEKRRINTWHGARRSLLLLPSLPINEGHPLVLRLHRHGQLAARRR
jgi:hypothetical protein